MIIEYCSFCEVEAAFEDCLNLNTWHVNYALKLKSLPETQINYLKIMGTENVDILMLRITSINELLLNRERMNGNIKYRLSIGQKGTYVTLHSLSAANEDIYANAENTSYELVEDEPIIVEPRFKIIEWHEEEYRPILMGDDLDVPDAELDGCDEFIGEDDEEDNY